MASRQEIINYITQAALQRGIDPQTALKVFHGESGFNPSAKLITPREASYGVTQLNIKNGLGVDALRRGIDPRDPSQWKETIDFSLDHVKRGGWTPWSAATKAGVSRWGGVQRGFNPDNIRPPKSIDIGDKPTLASLNPPTKTLSKPRPDMSAGASTVLSQLAPTEDANMARPSIPDAIREAMDETIRRGGVRYAGFVPPGLTAGAAKTRAQANKGVQPRGTMKDVEGEAKRAEELRNVPNADKQMEGSYADYVRKQHEEMAKARGDLPPGVKSATDPKGAVDPRTGTALERTDPNLAAQNDPAGQALIAAKIRGYAKPGVGAADPGPSQGAKALGAAAAVTAGGAAGYATRPDEDPAVKAVEQQMQAPQQANVDPGTAKMLAAQEQSAGLPPGTLSGGNAGWKTSALPVGGMLKEAMPVFQEVVKDPQAREAVKVLATKAVQVKARQDAMAADVQKDPTYYQRTQSMRQQQQMPNDPNNPLAERQMMDAVSRDQRGSMARRMPPQAAAQDPAVAMVQQQMQAQPPRPPRGVPSVATPQDAPGEELGERNSSPAEEAAERGQPWALNNPYPPGVSPTPGAYEPTGGIPQGVPNSGQMPMDPMMMQLMQFFTGGGGSVGEGP